MVVTVHDLTFLDHPEWHERAKVLFFRRMIPAAAAHASVCVCVSNHTAGRLAAWTTAPTDVMVIHHGVDHERFAPGGDEAADLPRWRRWAWCLRTSRSQAPSSRARTSPGSSMPSPASPHDIRRSNSCWRAAAVGVTTQSRMRSRGAGRSTASCGRATCVTRSCPRCSVVPRSSRTRRSKRASGSPRSRRSRAVRRWSRRVAARSRSSSAGGGARRFPGARRVGRRTRTRARSRDGRRPAAARTGAGCIVHVARVGRRARRGLSPRVGTPPVTLRVASGSNSSSTTPRAASVVTSPSSRRGCRTTVSTSPDSPHGTHVDGSNGRCATVGSSRAIP